MGRTRGPYMVTEAQLHINPIDKEGILNRVVTDPMTPVQNSTEDAKQTIYSENDR